MWHYCISLCLPPLIFQNNNDHLQLTSSTQVDKNSTVVFFFGEKTEANKSNKSSHCTDLEHSVWKQTRICFHFCSYFIWFITQFHMGRHCSPLQWEFIFIFFLAIVKGSRHIAHKVLKSLRTADRYQGNALRIRRWNCGKISTSSKYYLQ